MKENIKLLKRFSLIALLHLCELCDLSGKILTGAAEI
jgi:hypothetical protein